MRNLYSSPLRVYLCFALIAFAGPRVIEQTIKQKLPDGFQRSEHLQEHGMIDMIVDRRQLRTKIAQILAKLTNQTIVLSSTNNI